MPACYDAQAQVLWNALAPELWRRATITLHRALARLVGLDEAELRQLVRVSYAKVAEFQRRGAISFHAVIRLDAATACHCPDCLLPPPEPFDADLLENALKQAVPVVRVLCPPLDYGGPAHNARWGKQLDVHNITREDGDQAGELSAEQVAGYIAKYATKATESFGSGLDRRLTTTTWTTSTSCPPTSVNQSEPAGRWVTVPSWRASDCGPGRPCSASVAIDRPRAAATRPPSVSCAEPECNTPSAAGPATACP